MSVTRAGLVFGLGAIGALVTGLPGRPHAYRPPPAGDPAAAARIADNLRRAPPDAVLLAGNSHAAGAADLGPPCTPWVNAGIGGATARSYAATLALTPAPGSVAVAVLVIGTNDILRRDQPLSAASVAEFRTDAARTLSWLEARAARVLVAAVPPIGPAAVRKRDPAAVAIYSAELAALCQAPACSFVDPFADLRDGAYGLAWPGALVDGVHLADYPAMLSALGVCPASAAQTN